MYPFGDPLAWICFSSICSTLGAVSFFNLADFSSYRNNIYMAKTACMCLLKVDTNKT